LRVLDTDTELVTASELAFNLIPEVASAHDQLSYTLVRQLPDQQFDKGPVPDWSQRFGSGLHN
jgi:hypothetical protein